jgi:hypothetical protein
MRLFKLGSQGKLGNIPNLTQAYGLLVNKHNGQLRRAQRRTKHENFKGQLSLSGLCPYNGKVSSRGPFFVAQAHTFVALAYNTVRACYRKI